MYIILFYSQFPNTVQQKVIVSFICFSLFIFVSVKFLQTLISETFWSSLEDSFLKFSRGKKKTLLVLTKYKSTLLFRKEVIFRLKITVEEFRKGKSIWLWCEISKCYGLSTHIMEYSLILWLFLNTHL